MKWMEEVVDGDHQAENIPVLSGRLVKTAKPLFRNFFFIGKKCQSAENKALKGGTIEKGCIIFTVTKIPEGMPIRLQNRVLRNSKNQNKPGTAQVGAPLKARK